MDYERRIAEIRAINADSKVRDAQRVRSIEEGKQSSRGSIGRTSAAITSGNPYMIMPVMGGLTWLAITQLQHMKTAGIWYIILILGVALPALAWLYALGLYQRFHARAGFGLGWVMYRLLPCSFAGIYFGRFIDWDPNFISHAFDNLRGEAGADVSAEWTLVNRVLIPLGLLNVVAGIVAVFVLLARGLRRHRAEVETPPLYLNTTMSR